MPQTCAACCDAYVPLLAQCKQGNDVIFNRYFFVVLSIILLKVTTSVLKWAKANSCRLSGLL